MGRALEGGRDLPLRPHPQPRGRLLHRHPAAHGQRQPARRARLLLHPHRPHRALPADAGQERLLPDGLGRQRPAHRASRAELLRRALRPLAAVRRRLHAAGEAGPEEAGPDQPAQLHRAVRAARGGGREGLRVAVAHPGPLGRLVGELHDDRAQVPGREPDRVPAQLRPRRGLPPGGADPVGRHLPDRGGAGRARGARLPRRLPPGGLPPARRRAGPHRDHPPRADPQRRRAHRAPRRRAVRRRCSAPPSPRRSSASRSRCSRTRRPSPTRAPASRCAARSATSPTSCGGASSTCPVRTLIGRDGRMLRETPEWLSGDARRGGVRGPQGQDDLQRPRGGGRRAARERRPRRRAHAHPADGQLLREGRQAARDRGHPPVVHPQRRPRRRDPRRDAGPRRRGPVDPGPHEAPLRQLGRRPQRRLAHQPPALLRHPVPRLVPARRRRRPRLRPPAHALRGRAAGRPVDAGPARLRRGRSGAGRAASSATRTSWTPGRRRR